MKSKFTALFCSLFLLFSAASFGQAGTYWHDRIDTTIYAITTGTDTYVGTNANPNFNVARYNTGLLVTTFIVTGNTGASTYQLVTYSGALAARPIRKQNGAALVAGDIPDSSAVALIYYGTFWRLVGIHASDGNFWSLTGNAGTTAGTNFIGTTDAIDFVTKTNNAERIRVLSTGEVGIGTSTPTANLSFSGNTAQIIQMERHTTANTAGNNFAIIAGGATAGATDKSGGDLLLSGGYAEGTGTSKIQFYTTTTGTGTPSQKGIIDGAGAFTLSPAAAAYNFVVKENGVNEGFKVFTSTTGNEMQILQGGVIKILWKGNGNDNYVNAGNTGFGNAAPSARVHITGSGATSATFGLKIDNSSSNAMLYVDNVGNVGIRQSTPSHPLTLTSSGVKFSAGTGTNILSSTFDFVTTYRAGNGRIVYQDGSDITGFTSGLMFIETIDAVSGSMESRWYDGTAGTINNKVEGNGNNYFNSGNFSIGTTGSNAKLEVVNTNTAIPTLQLDGGGDLFFTYDGRLYGSALHNNAGAVTGTTNQYIASGTYTFTPTDSANTTALTPYEAQWMRVGNVVTVSGVIDVDPDITLTTTIVKIPLPIASNFSAVTQLRGTANAEAISGQSAAMLCTTVYASDFALMKWVAVDVTNQPMSYIYTYQLQ